MRDREQPLEEAQSANALKLLELEQLGLLQTYKNYEQSLRWLRDLNINGYNFQIDQPSVNWKAIFDGAWLKEQILTIFGWSWYILEKMAVIYAMISMILFITNLAIKFYNAFAFHKAIGKQASITKILLTGIFGIFSQTLTQLVAQIQEEDIDNDKDDNNSNYGNFNNRPRKNKPNFRRHSTEVTTSTHNNNEIPTEIYVDKNYKHYNTTIRRTKIYVDTNYKHYNTTIRRTENGLQLRTLESSTKIQKPPLPERKYQPEPFKIEPLETIKGNKLQTILPHLITPPPAYQCLGNSLSAPIPSAPKIEQLNILFNNHPYETPLPINQPTTYEIPKPSSTSNEQKHLIPTSKLLDIQNPPPIDFDQLKLTANKMHNRSHSLDILKNDQPHTNEVTYFDTHSADTYEI